MALSKIQSVDNLYVGGIWALRRSDSLKERHITHVLSLVSFNPTSLRNFNNEPFSEYGKPFKHLLIDIDDVEDSDLLVELPRAVRFIEDGLRAKSSNLADGVETISLEETKTLPKEGAVFVHCAAGKSRSVSVIIAYLLWRYPDRFDRSAATAPSASSAGVPLSSRKDTAAEAVSAALQLIRQTRPMAEPNEGFMEQLALWWEMGCPADEDMENQPVYQRWAYKREVKENLDVGQAPTKLRFEDEVTTLASSSSSSGPSLRCKKCRLTLATAPYILAHKPQVHSSPSPPLVPCQHHFIEALSWMRPELEKGALSGRLTCPNTKCGAGVGRYDWKGFRCSCGGWETPAFSLQKARVDEELRRTLPAATTTAASAVNAATTMRNMGIRMPPGSRGGNL